MVKFKVLPIENGLQEDVKIFNIKNDAFSALINAYQWRGRVLRKRGTALLNRLIRNFYSLNSSYSSIATITLDAGGNGNLITGFGLEANSSIVIGSVTLVGSTGPVTYTDPTKDGYLTPTGTLGPNTINYASGAILIPAQASATISAIFNYYPQLPSMGLEDLVLSTNAFPGTLDFDTKYAYNQTTTFPATTYNVSFYKNPPTGTYPGYIQKTNTTPLTWNGQDYQQFWSMNYQGAFWVTNGINIPFSISNIGMQYKPIVAVTVTSSGPPAIVNLNIVGHGLVIGDFLFINEVITTTGINFQTGYVTAVVDANNITVEFPNATITTNGTGGIAQYLTNRSDPTKDCLRWYDGDPTNGITPFPALIPNFGWVNFCPPLSEFNYSIADLPIKQWYLVGARMIIPFKDRSIFIGPVIQNSSAGSQVYLQDTVIYSQNGTPYYTASYTNSPSAIADTPTSPTNAYTPILIPINQTSAPNAYFEDQTGFGGFKSAGIDQQMVTVGFNGDAVIIGLRPTNQIKMIYTSNDIDPFNFYGINTEYGSSSTFSGITFDAGVMTKGDKGYTFTNQDQAVRMDDNIPDEVFQTNLQNNGNERVCAQRDFINEWVYFSYPDNQIPYKYPNTTLQYNYINRSWAKFYESYTTYGTFRQQTGYTWSTIGQLFPSWNDWNEPWNAGSTTLLQPKVIAGNQQGFVLTRDEGTGEGASLAIQSISGNTITCPNHCLNEGDYITISGALGTIGTQLNGKIFSIVVPTTNTFMLNPSISAGTYFGGALITRMYVPFIQTKQFPIAWDMARKVRLGPQQYLLTKTPNGQIQLLIFLSQNDQSPYNDGPIIPDPSEVNGSLVYSTVLYTCPESTNLGLTPANINLNTPTAHSQGQIWHRKNTSLIGDTVQIGFTMSDTQMRDTTFSNQFEEIEVHGYILDVSPSSLLC